MKKQGGEKRLILSGISFPDYSDLKGDREEEEDILRGKEAYNVSGGKTCQTIP